MLAKETLAKINKQLKETREPISADDIEAIIVATQDAANKKFWDDCRRQGMTDSEIFGVMLNCPAPEFNARAKALEIADQANAFLKR